MDGADRDGAADSTDRVGPFLAHYGKKGMKWGVRKSRKVSGSSESSTPAKAAPKKSTTAEGAPAGASGKSGRIQKGTVAQKTAPKASQMTDDELRKAIARIDMERRYSTLTAPPPKGPTKGQAAAKLVSDILLDVGKQQAKAFLNDQAPKIAAKTAAKVAARTAVRVAVKAATK